MAEGTQQQIPQGQNGQNDQIHQNEEQLSEADKQVYDQIFKSLNKINKKVQNAKSKLHNKESAKKQEQNITFKQIAQKLIQSKQNSQIVNKQDILTDINQSFQRAVIDVYSQNQKLKRKQIQIEKIIKEQNQKIFDHKTKQQNLNKQIQKLRFQMAQFKDSQLMINRGVHKNDPAHDRKQPVKKIGQNQSQSNQNNEDYDFWNMPQNQNYGKKKKQFVQNSGLWVNQKSMEDSMFITQGKR